MTEFRGNYFGGAFVPADGSPFASVNPARDFEPVLQAHESVKAVDRAVAAAAQASGAWRVRPVAERIELLRGVQARLPEYQERIAQAITAEMGKPIGEARIEAGSIKGKIEGTIGLLAHELPAAAPAAPGEQRFRALGVVAIIGPFNFPIHLVNTYVIPALLTGNSVVIKPTEIAPLCGQLYAELFDSAGLPPGVFNMVQGRGAVGAALVAHRDVTGVLFTGAYETGRRIRQATFDQPHKKVSLELGGNNVAVVLADADLEQAAREIMLGGLLSAGQRCNATRRVIVEAPLADALRARLVGVYDRLRPADPCLESTLFGPLATARQREVFFEGIATIQGEGAKALVSAQTLPGGAFVSPGISEVSGEEPALREEIFGPHLNFEVAADRADAFRRAANNDYGLSAALFSADPAAAEAFYEAVPVGVLNLNRATNGASGLLPFGGVGKSGNWMPAGAGAARLCTHPVAVLSNALGHRTPNAALDGWLEGEAQ